MAHEISWYMGRRILYVEIGERFLSARGLQEIDDQLTPFLRYGDSEVHVILDASRVDAVQPNLPLLLPALAYVRHPKLGWNVLVASDPVARAIQPLAPGLRSFGSLEEGLFFLEDEDTSLLMPI